MTRSVSPDETPAGEALPPSEPLLLLLAGGRRFGLALAPVREVVTARAFTRLPGAPTPVRGLVNLRGRITTVVDLGLLLELPSSSTPGHRVVVVEHRGRAVGLAVDDVLRIVGPARPAAEGPPEDASPALPAEGAEEEEPFAVLDASGLLGPLFA